MFGVTIFEPKLTPKQNFLRGHFQAVSYRNARQPSPFRTINPYLQRPWSRAYLACRAFSINLRLDKVADPILGVDLGQK